MVGYQTYDKKIIPTMNPYSREYKEFWREEKRKCIEGTWYEGKYMPGILYFFVNYWTIELNKDPHAKVKTLGQPFLRDLEWERAYYTIEARGFSGFKDDPDVSCHRGLASDYDPNSWNLLPAECFKADGTPKRYVPAREFLFREHTRDLGKPLFQNEARNVIDIEARGGGKSFWMSVTVAHNFLFDGALDYDQLREDKPTSETLIGAIDSFYSNTLINKVQLGLNNLRGDISYAGKNYPSPLSKAYSGSWVSGKHVIAEIDIKEGGNWVKRGSRSKIQHRSFKDNPFAGNGTRPGWSVFEEIGFFDNLIDTLGQMKETTNNGAYKFGAIWMSGTGGDMVGGATEAAKEVFYNPEKYDCIAFDDEYEGSPFKIGMFMPAWKTLNQFKDDEGNTNPEPAKKFLEGEREKASQGSDKKKLNDELQQRPVVPSEAFLLTTGNVFPIADLVEHLKWLETSTDGDVMGQAGRMVVDPEGDGTFMFKPYLNKMDPVPCDYPVKSGEDHTGAIQIWEHPDPNAQYGWYPAGNDPYDLDEAPNSSSLGSTIIVKRATIGSGNHDKIVAEYTARPSSAKEYYEQARRLLIYYNAICLYENEKIGIKTYFEQKHSLYLLAYTPTILKANQSTKVNRVYGQNMGKNVKKDGRTSGPKAELEIFLRDWLQEPAGDGKMNLHFIYSKPIIKELIAYNDVGNYDRVIALMLAVAQREQMFNIAVEEKEEIQRDDFFGRTFFQSNNNVRL